MCYCGRSQVSGWGGPALWRLGPGPRTGTAIPLGPLLQKTPAALAQVHLTPDVVNKNGKEKKREHPPSLIPFGKSPGCQVPYIMPAQADTCAGAGWSWIRFWRRLWPDRLAPQHPDQKAKGKRNEFRVEGWRLGAGGMVGTRS